MLDLDAIKGRWTCWHDYEESSAVDIMLSGDIPALIAEVERLTQPYVKEGIEFCAVCGTALGDEEDVFWVEEE